MTGLSKLARCVEGFASRPQVQERLTAQIADALEQELGVQGAAVIIEAQHMCMTMRGVRQSHPLTETVAFRGVLAEPDQRREVLLLIKH